MVRRHFRFMALVTSVSVVAGLMIGASATPASAGTLVYLDTLPAPVDPTASVLSHDGRTLYVTATSSQSVAVLDTLTGEWTATIMAGALPYALALSPDGKRLYVGNYVDKTVSVIDTTVNRVVATVAIAESPVSLAVSPDGRSVYVAVATGLAMPVIDARSNSVTASFDLGDVQRGVAVSSTGDRVYISAGGAVRVFDARTRNELGSVSLGGMPIVAGRLQASPDGSLLYVLAEGFGTSLAVVDTQALKLIKGPMISGSISSFAFSPVGDRAYVSTESDNTIHVVDTKKQMVLSSTTLVDAGGPIVVSATGQRVYFFAQVLQQVNVFEAGVHTVYFNPNGGVGEMSPQSSATWAELIPMKFTRANYTFVGWNTQPNGRGDWFADKSPYSFNGDMTLYAQWTLTVNDPTLLGSKAVTDSPYSIGVTPDGKRAYIVRLLSNEVVVMDTATREVVATVSAGDAPVSVVVSPQGDRAYVSNFNSNDVSVIDTKSNQVVKTIPVGSGPLGGSVTPDGDRLFVVNVSSDSVSVVNTQTGLVTSTISVGDAPFDVSLTPDGTRAVVANSAANTVSVIDATTGTVTATIAVEENPTGVAVSQDGRFAYVASSKGAMLTSIDLTSAAASQTLAVDQEASRVEVSGDGRRAYVTDPQVGVVAVVDLRRWALVDFVTAGAGAAGLAVSPDGTYVYVANATSNSVSFIDSGLRRVSFDANGGRGSMKAQASYGSAALVANVYKRKGWVFAGWNTKANGSGTAYSNRAIFPFRKATKLYAQWKK